MVYAVGFFGFICGFILGQMILYFVLRNKTREELLNDRYIKIKYGLINWCIAFLGAWSFVKIYGQYFN